MWQAKFKITHDDWILPKTLKYNVSATGIPVNSFQKDGKFYHTGMIFLQGKLEDKKKFIGSLHKDIKIKHVNVKGNQVYVLIEGEDTVTHAFDESLFFVQPVLMKEGYEYWELGSWDRTTLIAFYNKVKKIADIEILYIKQGLPSVFIQHTIPKLTDKQRKSIELALEKGYYNYPRKISVEELAKISKVPRSTYQEHLRKAEAKLMRILLQSQK
ncbi:MAG: helix-turn-helix domain-containing protein [archaeon]